MYHTQVVRYTGKILPLDLWYISFLISCGAMITAIHFFQHYPR